jgi:hypothetical protein
MSAFSDAVLMIAGLGGIKHRMKIDPKGVLPLLITVLADVLDGGLMRGVMDENIDAAQFLDGAPNDGATMGGITDIACDEHGLAPLLLDQILDLLGVVMLAQICNQDIGALPRIGDRNGAPMPLSPPVITAFMPCRRPAPL